ncbi:MAG: M48 family metallopeptidase, partial [Magnetococcales bacterium]|nr:M48 family metallopeptidase [Magnetococcales bacterium]
MSVPEWNGMALLFAALLVAGHALESVALVLDGKRVQNPLPGLLARWVEAGVWEKTQHYTRARHRLALWESTTGLLLLLIFWFAGGFGGLDRWVAAWQLGELGSGLAYLGLVMLLSYGINLPFTIYHTFVLEARFGFNRTTWKTFVADQLKMALLALVLGGAVLGMLLSFFNQAGAWAWLYGWLGVTLFSLLMQLLIPRWILPLFNRFSPLEDGEARRAILAYAHSVNFPVGQIFAMDGSRRSSKANAFVTGFGKNRRIALFDTLLQQHTVAELVAILAHEVGHARKHHMAKTLLLGMLHTGILFYLLSLMLAWPGLYQGFFMEGMPLYAGLLFFGLVIGPLDLFIGLLFKKLSRQFELEADRFALETAPEPAALISALQGLAKENLTNWMPHPLYVMLHYSHPPLQERLAAM